jgi:hypothetical protein
MYSDTDSLIFELPDDAVCNLPFGAALHQWKSELPANADMISFHSLGPKFYQYTIKDRTTGAESTVTKLKGFHLKSAQAAEIVHPNLFEELVHKYLSGRTVQTILKQWGLKTNKRRQIRSQLQDKIISNNIFSKRVAFRRQRNRTIGSSLPFGYTTAMYAKYIS